MYATSLPSSFFLNCGFQKQKRNGRLSQENLKINGPNCLGALDGKHVAIKPQPIAVHTVFTKNFFSIVLLAVVNANYGFIMVDAEINGHI